MKEIQELRKKIEERDEKIESLQTLLQIETKKKHNVAKIADVYTSLLEFEEEKTEHLLKQIDYIKKVGYCGFIPMVPEQLLIYLKVCENIETELKDLDRSSELKKQFNLIFDWIKGLKEMIMQVDDDVKLIGKQGFIAKGKIKKIFYPNVLIETEEKMHEIYPASLLMTNNGRGEVRGIKEYIAAKKELSHTLYINMQSFHNLCAEENMLLDRA